MSFTDRLGMTVPQAVLAWALVVFVGGASGVIAMLLCHYLLTFGGQDSANKHGISKVTATRLGGVAIVSYLVLHLGYLYTQGLYLPSPGESSVILAAIAFFILGIYEDMTGTLSARLRFGCMLAIGVSTLFIYPDLTLKPVGIFLVDLVLGDSLIALLFTALCVAFLPNAFNTADGANGLVSGISVAVLGGLSVVAPAELSPLLAAGAVGCLVFLVFNLISGRFFLGDGGAYFLGAFCGLAVVIVSNTTDVSVWWLLAMIFYPVADLLWSMGRRLLTGSSPFAPDNQHFHNLLFAYLNSGRRSSMQANTTCGVGIAVLFSWLPLAIGMSGSLPVQSGQWLWIVIFQWIVFAALWRYLSQRLCVLPAEQTGAAAAVALDAK